MDAAARAPAGAVRGGVDSQATIASASVPTGARTSVPTATANSGAASSLSLTESLRYLSWYSAMIVSHYYVLEQSFMELTRPGGSDVDGAFGNPGAAGGLGVSAVSVMDAWGKIVIDSEDEDRLHGDSEATPARKGRPGDDAEDDDDGKEDLDLYNDITDDAAAARARPATLRTVRRPTAIVFTWWDPPCEPSSTHKASPATAQDLIAAFDKYFFPTYLFGSAGNAGTSHGHVPDLDAHSHTHGMGGNPMSGAAATNSDGTAAATEAELRAAFHEFIELGHRLTYAALSDGEEDVHVVRSSGGNSAGSAPVPTVTPASGYHSSASNPGDGGGLLGSTPLPTNALGETASATGVSPVTGLHAFHHGHGGGAAGGYGSGSGGVSSGGGGGVGAQPQTGPAPAAGGDGYKAVLTLLYSLAFDCPCAALAAAAQLLLASAMARLSTSVSARASMAGGGGGVGGGAAATAAAAVVGPSVAKSREQAAAFLLDLLPHMTSPAEAGETCPASPTSPSGGKASSWSAAGTALGSSSMLTYTPRLGETLLWLDASGHPHLASAADWLAAPLPAHLTYQEVLVRQRRRARLAEAFGAATVVCCGDLPRASTLPAVDRLLLSSQGLVSGELAGVEGAMEGAVEACAQEALAARSGGSAVRRRRPGPGGSPVLRTTPLLGASILPGTAAPAGPGTPTNATGAGASRTKQLLCVLSRCHTLVPQTQRAASEELLYSIFTEHGECPGYLHAMALYPDLLRAHYTANRCILLEEGPLPLDERLMVAVMAASRHRCEYLVCRYAALLLRYTSGTDARAADESAMAAAGASASTSTTSGAMAAGNVAGATAVGVPPVTAASHLGDGVGTASPADADNADVVETRSQGTHATTGLAASAGAAHSPAGKRAPPPRVVLRKHERWLLEGPPPRLCGVQRFIGLAVHTPWRIDEDTIREVLLSGWTVPELFQLTAILAHLVPLSAIVMGLGVPVDPWTLAVLPPDMLLRLRQQRNSGGGGRAARFGHSVSTHHLHKADSQNCLDPAFPEETTSKDGAAAAKDIYALYAGEDDITSEQRIKGGSSSVSQHTLWREQFTWHEVGATYMEQYYPGAAAFLNEELDSFGDIVRQLNEGDCVSLKFAQVSPAYAFRSLQLYVLNVLGFMVEDYAYNEINKVLLRPAKWIAQALTMRPEALSREDVRRWATCAASLPPTASSASLTATPASPLATASSSQRVKQEVDLLAAGHKMGPLPSLLTSSVLPSASGGFPAFVGGGGGGAGQDHAHAEDDVADETHALTAALELQDNRVLLLIMLASMFAREEGLLHILLYPLCSVLSNM